MTLTKAVIEFGLSDFCRELSFVTISQVRALTDIAILISIRGQRLKKFEGLDKVTVDLHKQQTLSFQDAVNTELLGYNFND
jgi:hypothetical protein